MVLEKLYQEDSSLFDEESFSKLCDYAVKEPHNALVIDTHPLTDEESRHKLKIDIALRFSHDNNDY